MTLLWLFLAISGISAVSGIYNGTIASKNELPYVVLIHSPLFFCSGTLISRWIVLTAAHCLMSVPEGGSVGVTIGASEYYGSSVSDGELVKSREFWIHEKFSMPLAENDIGLIRLKKAVVVSEKVNFIGIDTRIYADYDLTDNEVVLAGWGFTAPRKFSQLLRFTKMNLLPLRTCYSYKSHYIEALTEKHICATKITGIPCKYVFRQASKILSLLTILLFCVFFVLLKSSVEIFVQAEILWKFQNEFLKFLTVPQLNAEILIFFSLQR